MRFKAQSFERYGSQERPLQVGETVMVPHPTRQGSFAATVVYIMSSNSIKVRYNFSELETTLPTAACKRLQHREALASDVTVSLSMFQRAVAQIATPFAVLQCEALQAMHAQKYFATHASLWSVMEHYLLRRSETSLVVLSHSPPSHLADICDEIEWNQGATIHLTVLNLAELNSEGQLRDSVLNFLNERSGYVKHQVLVLQYDPAHCSLSVLNHARHICTEQQRAARTRQRNREFSIDGSAVRQADVLYHVVFVLHLSATAHGLIHDGISFHTDFAPPFTYVRGNTTQHVATWLHT